MNNEHRKKISDALKGNKNASGKRDDEFRKKMKKSRTGKHHSEETRKKISETMKARKE